MSLLAALPILLPMTAFALGILARGAPRLQSVLALVVALALPLTGLAALSDDMRVAVILSAAMPMFGIYPVLAQERGLPLRDDAADYLVPRASRSQAELEKLVATIDRLSLERKAPPTMGIWRAALDAVHGPEEPRLI